MTVLCFFSDGELLALANSAILEQRDGAAVIALAEFQRRAEISAALHASWWVRSWSLLAGAAKRDGVPCSSAAAARRWFRAGMHLGRAIKRERATGRA